MATILSWNTLESGEGGAWSNGWGCPLEIQRREELRKAAHLEASQAERLLTQERYQRIRKTIWDEINPMEDTHNENDNDNDTTNDHGTIDFLLFQECTAGDFWDEPSPANDSNSSALPTTEDSWDDEFFQVFESLYEQVPCQDEETTASETDTLQHVYVRRNSGWVPISSIELQSDALVGGCLVEFQKLDDDDNEPNSDSDSDSDPVAATNTPRSWPTQRLSLVNLHGKSKTMRDPDLRRAGILQLWEEIESHFHKPPSNGHDDEDKGGSSSWKTRIVLCGDWNTQLSDLIEPFRNAANGEDPTTDGVGLEPMVGLLDNATAAATAQGYPFFSTNHEDGFLAQYDGCLWFGTSNSSSSPTTFHLELEGTSWNMTGFMPKGRDGRLSGEGRAAPRYNNFTYYRGSKDNRFPKEGVYLNGTYLPGSKPSTGLSDHLRIYTRLRIGSQSQSQSHNQSHSETNKFIDEALPSHSHQRRPYRHYDEEESSGSHENDRNLVESEINESEP